MTDVSIRKVGNLIRLKCFPESTSILFDNCQTALGIWQSKRVSGRVLVRRSLPLISFMACRPQYSLGQTGDVIRAYRVFVQAEVIAKCRDAHICISCMRSVAKRRDESTGWRLQSNPDLIILS